MTVPPARTPTSMTVVATSTIRPARSPHDLLLSSAGTAVQQAQVEPASRSPQPRMLG